MELKFNLKDIEKKVEALRSKIDELQRNSQPKIYVLETDSYRVMTAAEKEAELSKLNKALDTLWFIDSKNGKVETK